jgi:tripartite-type tricarboxylate transporter receptor subunit TctC
MMIKIITLCIAIGLSISGYAFELTNKVVTVVIPFTPGGGVDQTFRHLQKYAQEKNIQLVALYKPGAEGLIAMHELAGMPADGYHISLATVGVLAYHNIKQPTEEINVITGIRESVGAFVTHPNSQIENIVDLENAIKNKSNIKFGYGAPTQKLMIEQLIECVTQKSRVLMVPYKGSGQVLNDLLGGHIDVAQMPLSVIKPQLDSGKLKLLAVTKQKVNEFPNIPVINHRYAKWKDFDGFVIVTPAKINADALIFWETFLKNYVGNLQVQKEFNNEFTTALPFGAEHIAEIIKLTTAKFSR